MDDVLRSLHPPQGWDNGASRPVSDWAVLCEDCGKPVDPKWDYREVTGWERPRGATGGTNALRDRTETGRWCHRSCWDLKHMGGSLF